MARNKLTPIVRRLIAAGDGAQEALPGGLILASKQLGPFCALLAGRLGKVGPSNSEIDVLVEAIQEATGDRRPVAVSKYPQTDYYWPGRGGAVVVRLYWQLEPVVMHGVAPAAKQLELF